MKSYADSILNFFCDLVLSSEPARRGSVWLSRQAFDLCGIYFQPRAWPTIALILMIVFGMIAWLSVRIQRSGQSGS